MDLFSKKFVDGFNDRGLRLDANETAFLERELTQLRTKSMDVLYAENIARSLVPKATDIAASAERYEFKVYNRVGKASIGSYDASGPDIDLEATPAQGTVLPVTASYKWNINEMREAIRNRVPLSEKKAMNAREAIELGIDDMLFDGVPDANSSASSVIRETGLTNNADVEALGVESLTNWTAATPVATIQSEIYNLLTKVRSGSKQRYNPDTLVLPLNRYNLIAQKNVGTDNQMTILNSILQNNPFLKSIVAWHKLDEGDRAIAYAKNPRVLQGIVPQEFEQLPPQARGFNFVVDCHARCGGVAVYQPTGVAYGDFA